MAARLLFQSGDQRVEFLFSHRESDGQDERSSVAHPEWLIDHTACEVSKFSMRKRPQRCRVSGHSEVEASQLRRP
jgi:hypothetical protein